MKVGKGCIFHSVTVHEAEKIFDDEVISWSCTVAWFFLMAPCTFDSSHQAISALDEKDEEIQRRREAKEQEVQVLRESKDDTIEQLLKVKHSQDNGEEKEKERERDR